MYEEDSDDSWGGPGSDAEHEHGSDCEHDHGHGAAPASAEPQGEQRAALEAILDDFLQKYEVIGGKYRPQLEGTGDDKVSRLDRLRNELANLNLDAGEDEEAVARRTEKERILAIVERQYDEEANRTRKGGKDNRIQGVTIIEDNYRDRWDCETVLSASLFTLSLRSTAACAPLTPPAAFQARTRTCRTTRGCSACATCAAPSRPRLRSIPRRDSRSSMARVCLSRAEGTTPSWRRRSLVSLARI